jgi:hypothetical protein
MFFITLGLSHLSYTYVENPFRKSRTRASLIVLGILTASCFVLSAHILKNKGHVYTYTSEQKKLIDYFETEHAAYKKNYGSVYPQSPDEIWSAEKHQGTPCSYDNYKPSLSDEWKVTDCIVNNLKTGDENTARYLLIGDSNGRDTLYALRKAYPDKTFAFMMHSGCAAVITVNCFPKLYDQLAKILENVELNGVILSSRFAYQPIDGIEKTASFLQRQHISFLIVGSTPALRKPLHMVMIKKGISIDTPEFLLPLNNTYFHADIDEQDQRLKDVADSYGGFFWDKKSNFCTRNTCTLKSKKHTVPLFLDTQHLSTQGIETLAQGLKDSPIIKEFFYNQ